MVCQFGCSDQSGITDYSYKPGQFPVRWYCREPGCALLGVRVMRPTPQYNILWQTQAAEQGSHGKWAWFWCGKAVDDRPERYGVAASWQCSIWFWRSSSEMYPSWERWTATVSDVTVHSKYIPRNHVTRPIKSTLRWDSRVISNKSSDWGHVEKYTKSSTYTPSLEAIIFVQLFNRISPDIVMSLCWHGHHIWGPYGAISAGLGHGRGRSSAWGYRGEQSWPTADRSISWPNGSAIVPFVF